MYDMCETSNFFSFAYSLKICEKIFANMATKENLPQVNVDFLPSRTFCVFLCPMF